MKFPTLAQFIGAYFHQDWAIENHDGKAIVQQYMHDESPNTIKLVMQELDDLLSRGLSDTELRHFMLNDLQSYYEPEHAGQTMKEWLQWIRLTLSNKV